MEFGRSIIGAGNETRTRDLNLGKVALYQLSYSRPEQTRNCRAAQPGVKKNWVQIAAKVLNYPAILSTSRVLPLPHRCAPLGSTHTQEDRRSRPRGLLYKLALPRSSGHARRR